ncbi:MAG TPA: HAMP domain-containing sensor histidine kinase [Gaiellaceae bacterium]
MFGSLRVRLPLVFVGGILLAGVLTAAVSVRLFQQFAHDQAITKLSNEARGIAQLYTEAVNGGYGNKVNRSAPQFAAKSLEQATGDRIYFEGPQQLFPGQGISGLRQLPLKTIDWTSGKSRSFQFTPPGARRTYYAVADPILIGKTPIGALIVATPKTDVSHRVWDLIRRLLLAGLVGVVIAGVAAWMLSLKLVRPLLQLSHAADEVASGNYGVAVPGGAPGELGHLSTRFGEMASRLGEVEMMERNFLMSVSHELRTPLTAIRGHVSALLEDVVDDPDDQRASLETVQAEASRLERLVGDILDLAKLDTHRFTVMHEEVDMGQLIDQAYETFRDEARRRSIDYRREGIDRPVIDSDGDRVLQVVGNLLSNAFRATPDGGTITLELAQRNGSVHVAVSDNGPGISPTHRERLFRPFVTESGGTGLGLAIAKELSNALGGRIELESAVGKGARFELVLPARVVQPASAVGSL